MLSTGGAALAAARGPQLLRGGWPRAGRWGGAEGAARRGVRGRSQLSRRGRLDQDLTRGRTNSIGGYINACMSASEALFAQLSTPVDRYTCWSSALIARFS